ncbi:phage tail tape-measure protein [Salmonella enterica subsp. salamae]|nr:phage tail tape-measure protein [Salmonella enterica subsp. salamae]
MAGENAELGFSVDTSQVTDASKRLDDLAKSAQAATESASGLSDVMKNINGSASGMHARGFYSGLQSTSNKIVEEISETGTKAGKGFWSNFLNGMKENHGAQRELGFMGHELLSGNYGRLRGSASIFLSNAGMGAFGATGAVLGLTLAAEGIETLIDKMQEAGKAEEDLQTNALVTGSYSMLDEKYIDGIAQSTDTYAGSLKNAYNAMNSLMGSGFGGADLKNNPQLVGVFKSYDAMIDRVRKSEGDKAAEALSKNKEMFADAYRNPLESGARILKEFGNSIDDNTKKQMESAAKIHDADASRLAIQKAILEVMIMQDKAEAAHELASKPQISDFHPWGMRNYDLTGNQAAMVQSVHASSAIVDNEIAGYRKLLDSLEKIHSTTEEENRNFRKNLFATENPSHAHSGLTAAEKAAKQLVSYQTQIKQAGLQFDQQINSIGDSVNKAWGNKLYSYSMSADQHDFANRIETINEQFDRMRENVDRLALQHHKSIGSKEYVEMFQKIELGRKNVLAENAAGFSEMQKLQHSAIAGMDEWWIKYQKQVDDVASQTENVFESATNGMTDALTDFFTTGEADWKKYLTDILEMIEKILVRHVIVRPVSNYIGDMLGASAGGGATQSASSSMTANSYAVPSVPNLSASKGSGVGISPLSGINVYVYNQDGGVKGATQSDTKQGQDLGRTLQKAAQNWIKQQNVQSNKQGGVNRAMNSWSVK